MWWAQTATLFKLVISVSCILQCFNTLTAQYLLTFYHYHLNEFFSIYFFFFFFCHSSVIHQYGSQSIKTITIIMNLLKCTAKCFQCITLMHLVFVKVLYTLNTVWSRMTFRNVTGLMLGFILMQYKLYYIVYDIDHLFWILMIL